MEMVKIFDIPNNELMYQNNFKIRPHPLDLRQAILFWDVIQLPEELLPIYENDIDIQFLEKSGIIRKYRGPTTEEIASYLKVDPSFVTMQGAKAIYGQLRLNLFATLEKSERGQWAMARGIQSPEIPEGERTAGRGALVELTNMLPIPTGQVNLEDVMEFKSRRREELISLRMYMADLFSKVSSGDIDEMVKKNYLLQFEKSIRDYQSVISESRMKARILNLVSGFNVAGSAAAAISALFGQTGIIPISLSAIAGSITITPFSGLARRQTNEVFEYINQYHREISWHKN